MTDQNWIVTDCSTDTPQPWIYKGAAPGRSYEGLLLDVMKLGHENDELRQRIAELERELAIARHPSNQQPKERK